MATLYIIKETKQEVSNHDSEAIYDFYPTIDIKSYHLSKEGAEEYIKELLEERVNHFITLIKKHHKDYTNDIQLAKDNKITLKHGDYEDEAGNCRTKVYTLYTIKEEPLKP